MLSMEIRRAPVLPAGADGVAIGGSRASDNAEHYLRALIFSGQLTPGDRLPPERRLAEQLGISTLTLRAALRSLETAGFIVVKLGSKGGWWVNDAKAVKGCWRTWMRHHRHELDGLLEFRKIVETAIASLAAERRTPEDLDALELAELEPQEEWSSVVRWHTAFHDALAKAAHNEYLEWAVKAIRSELFLPVQEVISDHRVAEIRALHDQVLAAVRDRDPAAAADAMRVHLEFTDALFDTEAQE
jgi:GntR family transcriptional repressor for pyruvate dehydrogenase complex